MRNVEIHVEGYIDKTWSEWFEGFTLTFTEQNETLLSGVVPDQSALYAVITKLRDIGLTLVLVISKDLDKS